jgi:hypothetical protein
MDIHDAGAVPGIIAGHAFLEERGDGAGQRDDSLMDVDEDVGGIDPGVVEYLVIHITGDIGVGAGDLMRVWPVVGGIVAIVGEV